ncbi:MAG: tyrosine-protein phosphatase [Hyphomonadaceae bacterium]|nr:tyrosine-protein phosphatase [Hyphomonadaceae bacterium]
MSRMHAFEGIQNFRDFGDYPAAGKHVRKGLLYRSGHHARASDADVATMAAMKLSAIVDLRRPLERARHPSRRAETCGATLIANDDTTPDAESWSEFVKTSDLSADSFRDHSLRFYRRALFEPHYADVFARYFAALSEGEGPILVHCMGGKDRTGILAALTHTILGVHRDDIIEDFLLTNNEARFEREAPSFIAAFEELLGRAPAPAALRVAMGVEPAWLEAALGAATEACGSVEGYLETALGVDAKRRDAIEARLFV